MSILIWLIIQAGFLILFLTMAIMVSIALANAKNYIKTYSKDDQSSDAYKKGKSAVDLLGWATAIAWIVFVIYVLLIIAFVAANVFGVGEAAEGAGEAGVIETKIQQDMLSSTEAAIGLEKQNVKGASELASAEEELSKIYKKYGKSIVRDARTEIRGRTKGAIEEDMKNRLKATSSGFLSYREFIKFGNWYDDAKTGSFLGAIGATFLVGILAAWAAGDLVGSKKKANQEGIVAGDNKKSQDIHEGEPYTDAKTGHKEATLAAITALIPSGLFILWTIANWIYIWENVRGASQDVKDEDVLIDDAIEKGEARAKEVDKVNIRRREEKKIEAEKQKEKSLEMKHETELALIDKGVDPREHVIRDKIKKEETAEKKKHSISGHISSIVHRNSEAHAGSVAEINKESLHKPVTK